MGKKRIALRVLVVLTLIAVVTTLIAIAVNAATSIATPWPWGMDALRKHSWWWIAALTPVAALLGYALWRLQNRAGRTADDPPPPPLTAPPDWVIDRPVELGHAVQALRSRRGRAVGITTALQGAGGFGKTTLAGVVCADRRVRRRFNGRIYQITVGRDARGRAAIAGKVNALIGLITGEEGGVDDPQVAGQHLGRLLDQRPPLLLVIDDVWEPEQLEPFLIGGRGSRRLTTTRVPQALPAGAVPIMVDQMSPAQARAVLTWRLSDLGPAMIDGLLAATGRWPLLLRLINRIIVDEVSTGVDAVAAAAAAEVLTRLRAAGPAAVDDLGAPARPLDLNDPDQRRRAVRATIEAGTELLATLVDGHGPARFAELGIFAEDETIPLPVIETLWQATAGLDPAGSRRLCRELVRLSLITLDPVGGGTITIHDVVRDFLRADLGDARIADLNATLVDALAATLPPAVPLVAGAAGTTVAWWELGDHNRYLWDHLISHLIAAGRVHDAETTACDLRWIQARLLRFGPAAPHTDLAQLPTVRASSMRSAFARAAHLLTPTEPEHAVIDILYSRLDHEADWGPQIAAIQTTMTRPRLANRCHPPDTPDPAIRRTLTGHTGPVYAVAVAADGTWLASADNNGGVRIWDPAIGICTRTLTCHTGPVYGMVIAPDGTWLATADNKGRVRIWSSAAGTVITRTRTRHAGGVTALAIAPDSTWLATADNKGMVRVWDPTTGNLTRTLHHHIGAGAPGKVTALAIAPDGSWLASASFGTVRIWDTATGAGIRTFTGHAGGITALAIAPVGGWLAAAGYGTVRIWDTATGVSTRTVIGHTGPVHAVAIAPVGGWLAAAGYGTVRIWDPAAGIRTRTRHTEPMCAVAVASDGAWLATGDDKGRVGIWDPTTGNLIRTLTGHTGRVTDRVTALVIAPDSTWLATAGGRDDTVRIWDPTTGTCAGTLTGHTGRVRAMAIAPDGAWLATGDDKGRVGICNLAAGTVVSSTRHAGGITALAIAPDGAWLATADSTGTVRIWSPTTGTRTHTLTGHTGRVRAMAIAPGGTWLATGDDKGTVRIWNPTTDNLTRTSTALTDRVTALVIAPDGAWLATADIEGTVRIWDPTTANLTRTLTAPGQAVAISPDGTWLATTDQDNGIVRIWPPDSGQCAAMMRTDGPLRACAWMPDGNGLTVAGTKGLYLFDFHPGLQPAIGRAHHPARRRAAR